MGALLPPVGALYPGLAGNKTQLSGLAEGRESLPMAFLNREAYSSAVRQAAVLQ